MQLYSLTFNAFQENTYLLADEDGAAVVIDPGMSDQAEEQTFDAFVREKNLELQACWLTHAHLDHILGLSHIAKVYGLQPHLHLGERPVYEAATRQAAMYGMALAPLPEAIYSFEDGATVAIGKESSGLTAKLILAPGHSPASICFHVASENTLIGGDVLFRDSIGRTDLPGGDHETLLSSIRKNIYSLPSDTTVWPGHGPKTRIDYERANNPFVRPS